jgi:hypothetical protein
MVEDALPDMWHLLANAEVHPNVRLDVHKHLSKLADVEPKKDAPEVGPQFTLTLNLGGDNDPLRAVTIDATPSMRVPASSDEMHNLQIDETPFEQAADDPEREG